MLQPAEMSWFWLFRRNGQAELYNHMRRCERKWRRYGRAERTARRHGDTSRADAMRRAMIHWLGRYNSAVTKLWPIDD